MNSLHPTLPTVRKVFVSAACALTAAFMLCGTGHAALTVINGDFNSSLTKATTVDASFADDGWAIPFNNTWIQSVVQGSNAALRDPQPATNLKSMLQVLQDNSESTGMWTMDFQAISTDTGTLNSLTASIYGINTFSTGFTTSDNLVDPNATLLGSFSVPVSGETFTRTPFSVDFDLGTGYDYVVIRFMARPSNISSFVAVDTVSLSAVPEPGAGLMMVGGLGLLLALRRGSRASCCA